MMNEKCESALRAYTGRKFTFFVGRATTAIFCALKALRKYCSSPGGKVILPAVTCPNPAFAVQYAGLSPIFCDVNLHDFNLDVGSLKALLAREKDISAAVLVHLFGNPVDMEPVSRLLSERGIPIIEDVAQALGARYKGGRCGSFGDISVLSFNRNKILGLNGGGAILTDDEELAARLRTEVSTIPKPVQFLDEMQKSYRQLYYSVRALERFAIDVDRLFFTNFSDAFRPMYLMQGTGEQADVISEAFPLLEGEIETRQRKADLYRANLKHPSFRHPKRASNCESAYWRYSLLYDGDRDRFCKLVREKGIHISPWYPSIVRWFYPDTTEEFPNSGFVEKHIINLWTDPSTGEDQIVSNCEALVQIAELR